MRTAAAVAATAIAVVLVALLWVPVCLGQQDSRVLSPEFEGVTCQSTVKLQHIGTDHYLHSHPVMYGSGSEQQSVTGFKSADDAGSYFKVVGGSEDAFCARGTRIRCGTCVQLVHLETRKYVHSQSGFMSPLTQQQEVSCVGEGEHKGGDNDWVVECEEGFWLRDRAVRLRHKGTDMHLGMTNRARYGQPITGQLEVFACSLADAPTVLWSAREGIYYPTRDEA